MDPDPDPGGPKTCESCGSGSGSLTWDERIYTVEDGVYYKRTRESVSLMHFNAF
jgi:hypothetical protein